MEKSKEHKEKTEPQICSVLGCKRPVQPKFSNRGLCIIHEREYKAGNITELHKCVVKGCNNQFRPFEDKVPICGDCRALADKVWWIIQFTKPAKKEKTTVGGLILPGPGQSVNQAMKDILRKPG